MFIAQNCRPIRCDALVGNGSTGNLISFDNELLGQFVD